MCVCVCARARARVRACVRACVHGCVRVWRQKGMGDGAESARRFCRRSTESSPGRALCFMGRGALSRRPRLLGQEQGGLVRHAAHPRRPLGDGEVGGQVHLRGAAAIKEVLAP